MPLFRWEIYLMSNELCKSTSASVSKSVLSVYKNGDKFSLGNSLVVSILIYQYKALYLILSTVQSKNSGGKFRFKELRLKKIKIFIYFQRTIILKVS